MWSFYVHRKKMRQDFVSLTLSQPQSLGLFPTSADRDTFISKFIPCAKILKRDSFNMTLDHLYTSVISEIAIVSVRVASS